MEEISLAEIGESERQYEDEVTLVRCQTKPNKGTHCTVNGKEIQGGFAEAIKEGKKVAEEKGARVYFQNPSLNIFRPLEEFLESCPKLAQEIEVDEKVRWAKISIILVFGVAFIVYFLTMV